MSGRPRLAGERYPSGALKPRPAPKRGEAAVLLSYAQGSAARRYARYFERSLSSTNGEKRMEAIDELRSIRGQLSARQVALLDMIVGRGMTFPALALKVGQSEQRLGEEFKAACDRLAAIFGAES